MKFKPLDPALFNLAMRYSKIVGRPLASVLEGFEIIEAIAAIHKDYQEKPTETVTTAVAPTPRQRHRSQSTIAEMRQQIELHLRKNFGSNWFSKRVAGEAVSLLGITPYDTYCFIDVAYRNQKLEKQTRGARNVAYRFATVNFADLDVLKS